MMFLLMLVHVKPLIFILQTLIQYAHNNDHLSWTIRHTIFPEKYCIKFLYFMVGRCINMTFKVTEIPSFYVRITVVIT
jgi:hypothetical protein